MPLNPTTDTIATRFWKHVDQSGDCWVWTGSTHRQGYGVISGGRGSYLRLAHRVSYELHNGPIPAGLCVCHSCDNPPCVNPAHLFLGSQGDNNRDMFSKGRNRYGQAYRGSPGTANGRAKLDWEKVRQIRSLRAAGHTLDALSKAYGIGKSSVRRIVANEQWRE